jgi:uncharacterized protein DUF1326
VPLPYFFGSRMAASMALIQKEEILWWYLISQVQQYSMAMLLLDFISMRQLMKTNAKMEAIFQGKRGGPMEMISSLTSKWLPTQSTKININEDGNNLTVTVGSFGKMKYRELKNESGRTMTLQGAGFASAFGMDDETFALAPSASQWSDPDLLHQFSTKSGVMAKFSWRGS